MAHAVGLGETVTHEGAVASGELRLDEAIARSHGPVLTAVAQVFDVVASPVVGPLLVLAIAAALWRRRVTGPAALAGVTVFGWFAASAAKLLLHRHRPDAAAVHALVHENGWDSCPSGHTAFAASLVAGVVVALTVAGRPTRPAWMAGVPFVALVAASRLYVGAHFLGDVVTSIVLVTGLVLLTARPVMALARRARMRRG